MLSITAVALLSISALSPSMQGKADAAHIFAYSLLADESEQSPEVQPVVIPDAGRQTEPIQGPIQGRVADFTESVIRKVVGAAMDEAIKRAGMTSDDAAGIGKTVKRFNKAMDAFSDPTIRAMMEEGEGINQPAEKKKIRVKSIIFSALDCVPCIEQHTEAVPVLRQAGYTVAECKTLDEALAAQAEFVWITVDEVPKGERYPKTWTYADDVNVCEIKEKKTGKELDEHWQKHYRELFTARTTNDTSTAH